MARPSLLTEVQCAKAREMRTANPKRWSASKLAKHFGVSDSSMYNVLNGSYTPRKIEPKKNAPLHVVKASPVPPTTPLFKREVGYDNDVELMQLGEPSELEVAAAQLVIAKSQFLRAARALQHN